MKSIVQEHDKVYKVFNELSSISYSSYLSMYTWAGLDNIAYKPLKDPSHYLYLQLFDVN